MEIGIKINSLMYIYLLYYNQYKKNHVVCLRNR